MPPRYEPDESPKKKHGWDRDEPGFAKVSGMKVGKCPKNLLLATAQRLLDHGIPWSAHGAPGPHPQRIYAVHEGVPYRAARTAAGVYHGFPEDPAVLRKLPALLDQLEQRAVASGYGKQFKKWMRQ